MTEYLTPPELATLWKCTPETIVSHIKAGRLRAFTLSPPGSRRPRWRIPPDAIVEFESRQAARPPVTQQPKVRRSQRRDPGYVEYFT